MSSSGDLVGRDQDTSVVCAFVDHAARHGGSLVVSGEAGVGKTALIEAAAAYAAAGGLRLLRLTGAQFEAELLAQSATAAPLLIVADDLPWLDQASGTVLAFIARRTAGTRAGFPATTRTGEEGFLDRLPGARSPAGTWSPPRTT